MLYVKTLSTSCVLRRMTMYMTSLYEKIKRVFEVHVYYTELYDYFYDDHSYFSWSLSCNVCMYSMQTLACVSHKRLHM